MHGIGVSFSFAFLSILFISFSFSFLFYDLSRDLCLFSNFDMRAMFDLQRIFFAMTITIQKAGKDKKKSGHVQVRQIRKDFSRCFHFLSGFNGYREAQRYRL